MSVGDGTSENVPDSQPPEGADTACVGDEHRIVDEGEAEAPLVDREDWRLGDSVANDSVRQFNNARGSFLAGVDP